jgi:pSer/pThr/pTyr-binding forkhead associated (FHA) protein
VSEESNVSGEELIELVVEPATDELRAQSLLGARTIDTPVYTFGRRSASRTYYYEADTPDCLIAQDHPYTVSRHHCEIERRPAGLVVRDLNSRVGTIVNGKRLRANDGEYAEVELGEGEHSLVLGRSDGPIRFRLIVGK